MALELAKPAVGALGVDAPPAAGGDRQAVEALASPKVIPSDRSKLHTQGHDATHHRRRRVQAPSKGPRKLALDMDALAGLRGVSAVYIMMYHIIDLLKGSVIDLQVW
jgi:hypothetical protein